MATKSTELSCSLPEAKRESTDVGRRCHRQADFCHHQEERRKDWKVTLESGRWPVKEVLSPQLARAFLTVGRFWDETEQMSF